MTTFAKLFNAIGETTGRRFEVNIPVDISDLQIKFETPTGWELAVAAIKKTDKALILHTENCKLRCAAGHLVFNKNGVIKASSLNVNDEIVTKTGLTKIVDIIPDGEDEFYDISIYANHHSYYDANGLLHHNTWMIAGVADILAKQELRTLVIVPSSDLVEQTASTMTLGNLDVGVYSGNKKDIHHYTVVATWQALQNNPVVVEDFHCIIVDEAHGASAKTIGELINKHGKNCAYRFGFTGTFPKPKIDQMSLRGAIGEILFEISAADLIRMGYLAQLEIEPIEIQETATEEFPDYSSEKTFLSRNSDRLDFIADLIIAKADQFGNTFVLVNSVKQGRALQKLIKDSVFLYGATENDVRAEWYHMFENTDNLIVIATFGIASTGISIDRVFNLMMIDAGKSFVRTIQSIGRGLRKADDKERVHCVDIHSSLKWSRKHYRERKKYYESAQYPVLKVVKATA